MKNVAVVMGGFSDEFKVSLKSGELIYNNIDTQKYRPFKVEVLKEGWFCKSDETRYPIDKSDFSFFDGEKKISFDVAFNIVHGSPGENGLLQAYWDLIEQPYTGCDFYLSALTFNKKDTISLLRPHGINAPKSIILSETDIIDEDSIIAKLGLPCFVKPNASGSSLGTTKVNDKSELKPAIHNALKEDFFVLIEEYIEGREVSIGVIQYNGQPHITGITEIISDNEFFDYAAKYEGKSKEITPADLTSELQDLLEKETLKAYNALGMQSFCRSEFIIRDGIPYFLEMNTNPGFSPASILPQQLNYSGIPVSQFVNEEIRKALEK